MVLAGGGAAGRGRCAGPLPQRCRFSPGNRSPCRPRPDPHFLRRNGRRLPGPGGHRGPRHNRGRRGCPRMGGCAHRPSAQALSDLRGQSREDPRWQIHSRPCLLLPDEIPTASGSLMDLHARVRVGKTNLEVPRVGVGTAPLGNMFEAHSDEHADAVLTSAVKHGLRYFDTAPLYGHGLAEQRVGRAVVGLPRDKVVVSTKVGRLLRADAPRDESQFYLGEPFYKDVPPVGPVWDFSYDGVMTSVAESLGRTGLDRFDAFLLHDPDDHLEAASTTGFR